MTYLVFADDKCTQFIKKSERVLSDVVPHYGQCVASDQRDGRTSLTVCHNTEDKNTASPVAN